MYMHVLGILWVDLHVHEYCMYIVPCSQNSNNLKDDQLKHCTRECKGHREDDLNDHVSNLQQNMNMITYKSIC